jgi:hypothetical protein
VKTRSTLVLLLVSAPIALFAIVGAALADPPSTLPNPPNHRHFIQEPDGTLVPVGPQICGHPEMQQAFNEFHYNVHHSEYPDGHGGTVFVPTLGPQDGAPGLNNGRGGEIIGIGGCG